MTIKKEYSSTDGQPIVAYSKRDATSQNAYPVLDYSAMQELVDFSNPSIIYVGNAPMGFPQTDQGTDNVPDWPNWRIQQITLTTASATTLIGWGSWVNRLTLGYD